MGIFSSIGNAVKSVAGYSVPGLAIGAVTGTGPVFGGDKGPQQDPMAAARASYVGKLEERRKQLQDNLDKYNKEMPGMRERMVGAVGDEERSQADTNIKNIRKDATQRGLLYSGLREGQEAGAVGGANKRIAGKTMGINQDLEDRRLALQDMVTGAGLDKAAAEAGIAGQNYESDLGKSLEKRRQMSSIMGAGGALGGAALGSMASSGGSSGGGQQAQVAPQQNYVQKGQAYNYQPQSQKNYSGYA